MKKLVFIVALLGLASCSPKSNYSEDSDITGEWVLVKTWGQFYGSEQTGAEMPFQERYYFEDDQSFLKVRLQDGEEIESAGTYKFVEAEEGSNSYFELQHESANILAANCNQDLTEEVYFTSNGKLKSTYEQCDGPGVLYEKVD